METWYDKEKKERDRLVREVVSRSIRTQLRFRSVLLGIIILLATNYFYDDFILLSILNLLYLILCVIDPFGFLVHSSMMKMFDRREDAKMSMIETEYYDDAHISLFGMNSFVTLVINYAIFKYLMYLV